MLKKLFAKKEITSNNVIVTGTNINYDVTGATTILQSALDQNIELPHGCRVGGCGACKCQLTSGEVLELNDKSYVLSPEEIEQGYILACQSVPKTNVEIYSPELSSGESNIINTTGTISELKKLTHDILEVNITLDAAVDYTAGQFANISVPNQNIEQRSYSFANAPTTRNSKNSIAFHIRKVPGGEFTEWLHNHAKTGDQLQVNAPHGDFYLRDSSKPLLCIAGGSGMAPLKALLEQMQADNIKRDVTYLFGARTQADLYCVEEMQTLANNWPAKMEFIPVLSVEPEDSDWNGLRGFVTDHMPAESVTASQLYMCGPPVMLDAAISKAEQLGIDKNEIFFDKFTDKSSA